MQPSLPKDKTIQQQYLNINSLKANSQKSSCGYCYQISQYSWSFVKQQMHPYTYELLIQKGWRRSGNYYYKIDMEKSCCKLWTHRLYVKQYEFKKQHQKNVKNVARWLQTINANAKNNKNLKKQQKNKIQQNKIQKNKQPLPKKQLPKQQFPPKQNPSTKITAQISQISQKTKKLLQQSIVYFTTKIKQNPPQFYKLFSQHSIPQLPLYFIYNFDINKIKYFISSSHDNSDYYTNYISLLFSHNKKIFNHNFNCLLFVQCVKNFVQYSFNLWGSTHNLFIQLERSGYLLYTQFGSKKMEKKQQQKQLSANKMVPQIKTKDKLEEKQQHKQKIQFNNDPNNSNNQNNNNNKQPKQNQKNQNNTNKHPKQNKKNQKNQKNQNNTNKQSKQSKKNQNPHISQKPSQKHPYQLKITQSQITFGPLRIKFISAQYEKQSWELFQKYSQQIHDKSSSINAYKQWLCLKSLKYLSVTSPQNLSHTYHPSWQGTPPSQTPPPSQIPPQPNTKLTKFLGCYHMKYYLGKQLIGVGVVDLLPDGLSSVYFFYSTKYKHYQLGIFSSLIQIQYIRWLSLTFPQYQYYYLGFYLQNNKKMSYKANYQKFQLLCPITYHFQQFTPQLKKYIQQIQKYIIKSVQLSKDPTKISDLDIQGDIGVYITKKIKIKLKMKNQRIQLNQLQKNSVIKILQICRNFINICGKFLFQTFTFQI